MEYRLTAVVIVIAYLTLTVLAEDKDVTNAEKTDATKTDLQVAATGIGGGYGHIGRGGGFGGGYGQGSGFGGSYGQGGGFGGGYGQGGSKNFGGAKKVGGGGK